jgi:tetratricopeptide (TPR) repeat protein
MRPILSLTIAIAALTICGGTVIAAVSSPNDLQHKIISLMTEARTAYAARQFPVAEQKYNEAVALTAAAPPKFRITLLSNLGAAYREDHKYLEAEDSFKKALSIASASHLNYDPTSKLTMQQYAALLRKMNRQSEADAMEIRSTAGTAGSYSAGGESSSASGSVPSAVPSKPVEIQLKSNNTDPDKKLSVEELKARLIKNRDDYYTWSDLGNAYAAEKNWKEAADSYRMAVAHASGAKAEDQKQLSLGMVFCYYRAGDAETAMEPCRRLYSEYPNDSEINRLMSGVLAMAGDWPGQLAVDEQFLEKFPEHEDVEAVSTTVARLKRDISNKAKHSETDNRPTNDELNRSFIRAQMPLKVYIGQKDDDSIVLEQGATTAVTESTPGLIIQSALDAWSQATQGRVQFAMTEKPELADITCEFTQDPGGLETSSAAGITSWGRTVGGKGQAIVRLLTVSSHTGKPIERGEFANAALHEFGHALGLQHSDRPDDIMYRRQGATPIVQLSDNDKDRVVKLYTALP